MSDLVRSVARAICKSKTCEGAMCCQWPASKGRLRCPVEAGGYDDAARAAIAAAITAMDAVAAANHPNSVSIMGGVAGGYYTCPTQPQETKFRGAL